ncbi:MAG: hypothetical protein PHR77_17125 [Kiritimatiellae bacterium]|nr:hypothetical protein [Kiritimatiellia bacterium]MDD5520156.1 hypothetical protein [Kiritimatiellia bacterium]
MFKNLLKGILSAVAIKLLDNYRYLSVQLLKIEFAKSYLHGVRAARSSAIGLMCMGLVIALITVGMVLFHVGLFIMLPWTVKEKALLGIFLGLAYMIIGGLALRAAMKEKTWMEKSGATEMLAKVTNQSKS